MANLQTLTSGAGLNCLLGRAGLKELFDLAVQCLLRHIFPNRKSTLDKAYSITKHFTENSRRSWNII